ncbi:MAG TPA: dTDP-4-dehydrorhamnose 3,5-epimerase [Verrucomicrobiae bacterium]|nr:dTDP-4-dehydrorhamnose 3,5-epimerase [Verrucomicrobiae bacterium]
MTPYRLKTRQHAMGSMFEMIDTVIPGCVEIRPRIYEDNRGRFVKGWSRQVFADAGLYAEYAEEFYSVSRCGVVRGLHFQLPPMDQVKLVYCVSGRVQDAVLDLRRNSFTYGRFALVELSAQVGNILYIPKGLAHGFCTLSETATMVYKVSSAYSREHDCGVLWSSAGIPWSITDPILSDRDRAHPSFGAFVSPFDGEAAE